MTSIITIDEERKPLRNAGLQQTCYLRLIIIQDFKSYKGRHVLGPLHRNFNCIVGPNGSGKSNLTDALCFALGVDTKHLRGLKMSHLGYRSGSKEARSTRAEVQLHLFIEIKSSGGSIGESQEKIFGRKVIGDRQSAFFIDQHVVDKAKYYKALGDLNILPKILNCVVSQGRVETLSLKSSLELGKIIDEVSGSSRLKEKYDQLAQEISLLGGHLRRLNTTRISLDNEKKGLKKQVEELISYEHQKELVETIESQLYLFSLLFNRKERIKCNNDLEVLRNESSALQRRQDDLHTKLKEVRAARSQAQKNLAAHQASLAERSQIVDKAANDVQAQMKEVTVHEQRVKTAREAVERFQAKLDACYSAYTKLGVDLLNEDDAYRRKEKELLAQLAENEFQKATEEDRAEYLLEKAATEGKRQKYKLVIESLQFKLQALKSKKARDLLEIQEAHEALSNAQEDLQCLSSEKTTLEKKRGDLLNQIQAGPDLDQLQISLADRRRALHESLERIREIDRTIREDDDSRQKKAVLATLTNSCSGVHGRLIDLLALASAEYSTAIASALGLQASSIVCDSWVQAKECVRLLKEKRLPAEEFIPLDSVRVQEINPIYRRHPDVFLPGVDCVTYDNHFQRAVFSVLGDAVVVKGDIHQARKIAFTDEYLPEHVRRRVKFASLDGQKIAKNTNITLNSSHARDFGKKATAVKFMNKTLGDLKKRCAELKNEIQQMESSIGAATFTRSKRSSQEELEHIDLQLEVNAKSVNETLASMKALQERVEGNNKNSVADGEIMKVEKELRIQQDAEATEGLKLIKYKKLAQAEMALKTQTEEYVALKQAHSQIIMTLTQKVEELGDVLEIDLRAPPYDTLEKKCQQLELLLGDVNLQNAYTAKVDLAQREYTRAQEQLKELQTYHTKLKDEIKDAEMESGKWEEVIKDTSAAVQKATNDLASIMTDMNHKERAVAKVEMKYTALKESALTLINAATYSKVHIPLLGSSPEDSTQMLEAVAQGQLPLEKLDLDFSSLDVELQNVSQSEEYEKCHQSQEASLEKAKAILRESKPNSKARSLLADVEERLSSVLAELSDHQRQKQSKDSEFIKCRNRRSELFLRCFNRTRVQLQKIYSHLTYHQPERAKDTTNEDAMMLKHFGAPEYMGGRASLELEEEVCPDPFDKGVIFHAIPPDKRYMEVGALSGGEQSIAALALLFAMQSYSPSPFVILDEVDAALDPNNIANLRHFLKSVSDSQIIIVTLKEEMFSFADVMIGIYRNQETESSGTVIVDMSVYPICVNQ